MADSMKLHTLHCVLQSWFHLLYGQTKAAHDQSRVQTAPCCGFVSYSQNVFARKKGGEFWNQDTR